MKVGHVKTKTTYCATVPLMMLCFGKHKRKSPTLQNFLFTEAIITYAHNTLGYNKDGTGCILYKKVWGQNCNLIIFREASFSSHYRQRNTCISSLFVLTRIRCTICRLVLLPPSPPPIFTWALLFTFYE